VADNSIGPGTVLAGRFRLDVLLQEAAGARYWRATDQVLARSVAVHVVAASDPRAQGLLAAARISATLADVHLLRVLDAAKEDDVAYVVNEWGAGNSLNTILAGGPLEPRRAAWLVKEVAEAVSTAHRSGVAHGRLRPENVVVTEAGSVKVSGFVVDAALDAGSRDSGSPAQASEIDAADRRADVVALASLLYATLVGRWPGPVESALPPAPREGARPLRPRQVRAGVPRPLDGICESVLNSSGAQQAGSLETAQQFCSALGDFLGSRVYAAGGLPATQETTALVEPDRTQESPEPPTRTPSYGVPAADGLAASGAAGLPSSTAKAGPPWAAGPSPATRPPADPEATQAGAPVFRDEDSTVGWAGSDAPSAQRSPGGPMEGPGQGERPLFAPGPPARPTPKTREPTPRDGTDYRAAAAGAAMPATWGPDADSARAPSHDHPGQKQAGKRWLALAAVIAACLVVGLIVVLAFNLGDRGAEAPSAEPTSSEKPSETPAPAQPVAIASVDDFDPQGGADGENGEDVGLAIDGNPGTAWTTSTYYDPLNLLKDGVGLTVDLGEPTEVSEAKLTLVGTPTNLELLAPQDGRTVPAGTEGLETVASMKNAGTTVELELTEPVTTQYLVVWLTSLPAVEGGFKGQIAEIVVRS